MSQTNLRALVFALLVALWSLAASPVHAGVNTWTALGPPAFGDMSAFIIDPQTPTTMYVVTTLFNPSAGIHRSRDGGQTWQLLDLASPTGDHTVNFLTLDPTTSSTLYAGVGGEGIYKSVDGGDTWQAINNGLPITPDTPGVAVALAVHPKTPATLYAALNYVGLFRSTDGGASWSRLAKGLPPSDSFVMGQFSEYSPVYQESRLVINPEIPTTIYLAINSGIFKSSDGGDNWESGSGLDEFAAVHSVILEPETPSTLYTVTSQGLYKSTDAAASWTLLPGVPGVFDQGNFRSLLILPDSPQTLLLTSQQAVDQDKSLFRSTDGGNTWIPLANRYGDGPFALASDSQSPTTIYAYHLYNGMVFRSLDRGDTWTYTVFGSAASLSMASLIVSADDPAKLYAAASNGWLFTSKASGQSWTAQTDMGLDATFVVVDPISPTLLYAGVENGLLRSEDDGVTWQPHGVGLPRDAIRRLVIDPQTPIMLYAVGSVGVLRSSDRGDSWTISNRGLPIQDISGGLQFASLQIDPQTPTTLYVAIPGNGVYKSTDGARSWVSANAGLPPIASSDGILAIDPQTPSILYVGLTIVTPAQGLEQKLYKSADGGATWQALALSVSGVHIDDFIRALAIAPHRPSILYTLNNMGDLASSVDGGQHWYALPAKLPQNASAGAIVVDPGTHGRVYLATGGVQVVDLSAMLTVNVVVLGTQPADDWALTGPRGAFTLPAAGGSHSVGRLDLGAYDLNITPQPGYTVQSACTQGIGQGIQATAHAAAGQRVTCTFYAAAPDAPHMHLPVTGR